MRRQLDISDVEIAEIEKAGQQLIVSDPATAFKLLALTLRWQFASPPASPDTVRPGTNGDETLSPSSSRPPTRTSGPDCDSGNVVHLCDWSRRV